MADGKEYINLSTSIKHTRALAVVEVDLLEHVRYQVYGCQADEHVQQVAYSTYHDALTQVCFTCGSVTTNISVTNIEEKAWEDEDE